MFSKIDKKVIFWLVIAIIIILLVIFIFYKIFVVGYPLSQTKVQNLIGGAQTEITTK